MHRLSKALLSFFALGLATAGAHLNTGAPGNMETRGTGAQQFKASSGLEPLFIIGAGAIAVGMLRVRNRK
jgi:hypothetical protein